MVCFHFLKGYFYKKKKNVKELLPINDWNWHKKLNKNIKLYSIVWDHKKKEEKELDHKK